MPVTGDKVWYFPWKGSPPEQWRALGFSDKGEEIYKGGLPLEAEVVTVNDDGTVDVHVDATPGLGSKHLRQNVEWVEPGDDPTNGSRYAAAPRR